MGSTGLVEDAGLVTSSRFLAYDDHHDWDDSAGAGFMIPHTFWIDAANASVKLLSTCASV